MIIKEFKISKKIFRRRKSSTLQHKLRVIMKCYTILDFDLDDENKTFTFKKTHRVNGIKMNDPKKYSGSFDFLEIDENNINLRIIIGKTIDDVDK